MRLNLHQKTFVYRLLGPDSHPCVIIDLVKKKLERKTVFLSRIILPFIDREWKKKIKWRKHLLL